MLIAYDVRNASTQAIQNLLDTTKSLHKLDNINDVIVPASASLSLLLQFQRLLVAKIYVLETNYETAISADPGTSSRQATRQLLSLPTPVHSGSRHTCNLFVLFWFRNKITLCLCACADAEVCGAGALLRKYMTLLCAHVAEVLPRAASLAALSNKHFAAVAKVITNDVTGKQDYPNDITGKKSHPQRRHW